MHTENLLFPDYPVSLVFSLFPYLVLCVFAQCKRRAPIHLICHLLQLRTIGASPANSITCMLNGTAAGIYLLTDCMR
jgi:hypothetical protein